MNYLRKYSNICLLVLTTSTGFAGSMGIQSQSDNLDHSYPVNAWGFSGQALYLQTTYDMDHSDNGTYTNGQQSQVMIRPTNWDWGFYLDGRYYFGSKNDLSLEWYHYNQKSNYTFLADGWDPDNPETPSNIVSSFNPRWDALNFMLGQLLSLTDRTQIRLSGGAQYARLSNRDIYLSGLVGTPLDTKSSGSVTFNGFGARMGLDLWFALIEGIQVYDKLAGSILVGTNKFDDAFGGINGPITATDYESRRAVVPEVDMKLGIIYKKSFSSSNLSIDAGYMWVNYQKNLTAVEGPYHVSALSTNDLSLNGVYFGLTWQGNFI